MRTHLILPALAALTLATGCGSDDEPEDSAKPPASTEAATPSVPDQLLGTYTRNVTRADIRRTEKIRSEAGPNQERPEPGPVRLVITAAAMKFEGPDPAGGPPVKIDHDFTATADGKLTIDGYQHPEIGSFCGPEIPQNASYTWEVNGSAMSLQAVEDPCADRDSTFTGEWRR